MFRMLTILISTLLYCSHLSAQTYINHTRLIVSDKDREVTFIVYNKGGYPVLMQLWSDRGNVLERPETIKMPFLILPPVFRLEANTSQSVRVQFTGDSFEVKKDRESLFWLNVLEVPPNTAVNNNTNILQMAFRTRIKIFYRPLIITDTTPQEAVKKLHLVSSPEGLQLQNNSPIYISLLNITLSNGWKVYNLPRDGIIPPFSTSNIPLNAGSKIVSLTWIDDYGTPNTVNL